MNRPLKHLAKRLLGRPTVLPPVEGVADAKWYDAAYSAYDDYYAVPYWQSEYYFLWSVLADRIRTARLRHVVDIGCGPGQFAACLFGIADIETYHGLDFSAQAVAMAQRVCPRATFVVGDATTTALHQQTPHDVVVCSEVLEHVPGDQEVIARFKTGVRCLCTVPNFPYLSHVRHFSSTDEVVDRYKPFFTDLDVWALRKNGEHIYYVLDGIRNSFGR